MIPFLEQVVTQRLPNANDQANAAVLGTVLDALIQSDAHVSPDLLLSVYRAGRPSEALILLARQGKESYLLAISFRCHAGSVSGVATLATLFRTLRLNCLARTARRRPWSSVKRSFLSPICSRRTQFIPWAIRCSAAGARRAIQRNK